MVDYPFLTPGIPDELFLREDTPLTREEVRAVLLGKLRLLPHNVFWDIGAGTGAVAIEVARMIPGGRAFAVEARAERAKLIATNRARFGVDNLEVVQGEAPEALRGLPRPERVFVGGNGGRLAAILAVVRDILPPGGRLVVSAVTLETLAAASDILRWPEYRAEVTGLSVVRGKTSSAGCLLQGGSWVFVFSAEREGGQCQERFTVSG
ncbi:MAG: precorrin-6Y C5,15-methyltransferase (decarboxylating) subunit CbiT [Desulfotomaculales bacterium]